MKKIIIALVVLGALAAVAYLVFGREPGSVEEKAKLAAAIEPVPAEEIESIEVVRHEGTGETLREERIVLSKASGDWRMLEPVDYAVNGTSVQRMIDDLAAMRVIDIIAQKRERHHVLEVDDEMGIEVTVKGKDRELAHMIVGVSRQNMTMVRIPGGDAVYRVNGSFRSTFNKSARNLRDKTVTKMDRGSVTRVKFVNEKGELELKRGGEMPPDREGGEPIQIFEPVGVEISNFDVRKAAGTAMSLTGLVTKEFVDEPLSDDVTGLTADAPRVEFDATKDGSPGTFTIWMGKEDKEKRQTYIKTSVSEQVFLVSTHLVGRYLASADDFARTDEQVAQEEEQRAAAAAHAAEHEHHAEMQRAIDATKGQGLGGGPGPGAGGGAIPPEMMEKIRAQMEKTRGGQEHADHE